MSHSLNNICLVAALAAWVSVVAATGPTLGAGAQTAQAESGLDLQVVDPQGAVCAGAQIELSGDSEAAGLRWNTDQEGKARIQAASGEYSLTIKLRGFRDYKKRLTLKPGIRSAITATLSIGEGGPIIVETPQIPVIQADTPLLEPVPVPSPKPTKHGSRR